MFALLLALLAPAPAATGYAGLEWRPLSRQDLVWVEEGRTSGAAVGEFDGSVRSVLHAFGGVWFNRYIAVQGGLGLARLTTTSRIDDGYRQRHWGVIRPSVDLRFGWMEPRLRYPIPWVILGAYGDIPSVRDVSDAYTAEEQEAADALATSDRVRLGKVKGRVGMGVDYQMLPGVSLGAMFTVGVHRSTYEGADDTFTSLWLATDGALLVTFEWPAKAAKQQAAEAD